MIQREENPSEDCYYSDTRSLVNGDNIKKEGAEQFRYLFPFLNKK